MNKRYIFLALFLCFIFALAQLPARLVLQRALAETGAIKISNISGSVWQGRVDVVTPKMVLRNVQWRLHWWPLFAARVRADIVIDDGDVQVSAQLQFKKGGELTVRSGDVRLPARQLEALLPMRGLQLGGEVVAHIEWMQWQASTIAQLDAQLQWREAMVKTPLGGSELGAYRAQFKTRDDGAVVGDVVDEQGVLDLQGQLTLDNNVLNFNGSVKRELPDHVARFFKMFARDNGSRLEFSFNRPVAGASH